VGIISRRIMVLGWLGVNVKPYLKNNQSKKWLGYWLK
jgi:hypothetical protein